MDTSEKHSNSNPQLSANIFSRILFWWLVPLFRYGKNHDLEAKDLYDALPKHLSEPLGNKLERIWKNELTVAHNKNRKPSLFRAITKAFWWPSLKFATYFVILNFVLRISEPLLLGLFLRHFNPTSTTTMAHAFGYASSIVFVSMSMALIISRGLYEGRLFGMQIRIALSSLIYRKVVRLSSSVANSATCGKIINLLANDVARFEELGVELHYIWIVPLQIPLFIYINWANIGTAILVGILVAALQAIPIQIIFGKILSRIRSKIAIRTDRRILLMNEIINGIRAIKMYTWEKPFEQLVSTARRKELAAIAGAAYFRGAIFALSTFTEKTSLFIALLVYILLGNNVTADMVFIMTQYIRILTLTMCLLLPRAVNFAAEAVVSLKRVQEFLLLDEAEINVKSFILSDNKTSISIKEVRASWEKQAIISTLHDINLSIHSTKLCAVVGPVGSGKSSLLKLILGELQPSTGDVFLNETISYASQEPWLFNGSVRSNILFNEPYDDERYKRVVQACALAEDFEQFPYGDKTLVGDRGSGLSGGQCARINMARAVYRNVNVYIFDDPLSAVNARVANHLFNSCINGFLKGKTRILVTHHTQYLKEVDEVIVMNNGRIEFKGSFANFYKSQYYQLLAKNDENEDAESKEILNTTVDEPLLSDFCVKDDEDTEEPKETEELMAKGIIKRSLYWKYLKSGSSYLLLILVSLSIVLCHLLLSSCDFWVAHLANVEEQRVLNTLLSKNRTINNLRNITVTAMPEKPNDDWNLLIYVYGGLVLGTVIMSIAKNVLFFKVCINASRSIYKRMFTRLMGAPMRFFNANPSGRILNRFSKDTGAADETLPLSLLQASQTLLVLVSCVIQVIRINWWIVFAICILGVIYINIKDIYLVTAQNIIRLEGNAKSPVFSHVNSSYHGIQTIRSRGAQSIACREFDDLQDRHTAATYLSVATSSAFSLWMDFASTVFVACVTYSFAAVNREATFAGDVGLAISQSLMLGSSMQFSMKQTVAAIMQMTSVERLFQFTRLEQEGPVESEPGCKPRNSWPQMGEIRFDRVYLRYSDDEEPVLKNLNFKIEPGMKIGVVGRTGAGKSSLVSALFRLARVDNSLLIDDVDTKTIGLEDLRRRISIIPQEPFIFSASLRDNLDPRHEVDDASLWSALENVELTKLFDSLDRPVDREGSGLSSGQRQLLCLARAILKKNRILVLDEATANIDPTTENLIQRTIRLKFADCTVLTIAHRLNTIVNSDKVLVMDGGEVVEFDCPYVLMQRNDGYFARMVREAGNGVAQNLKAIAEQTMNGNLKIESDSSTVSVKDISDCATDQEL